MSSVIENGQRLPVSFGPYNGPAGVVPAPDGALSVAFLCRWQALRNVKTGEVDGRPVEVVEVAKGLVPGMAVLTVI